MLPIKFKLFMFLLQVYHPHRGQHKILLHLLPGTPFPNSSPEPLSDWATRLFFYSLTTLGCIQF